jgi:HSP20 family molecular chaperone IbpA
MTTLFEELFKPEARSYPRDCKWIKSSDDVYTAEFELAGFSKKEVNITATNDILKVTANKGDKEKTFSISLNEMVSPSDISSKMSNGLLTITMPKKQVTESVSIKIQ